MSIRLLAGATLVLITVAMATGCSPVGAPSPEPTSAPVESQEPTPTPTPTSSADPIPADEAAVQACTMIAEKNFAEPGVHDVLKDAAGIARDAAAADSQFEPLADSLTHLGVVYVIKEVNPDPFNTVMPEAAAHCDALGVSILPS